MRNVVFRRLRRAALITLVLAHFILAPPAHATQGIILSWYPVADPELAGYNVHYGTASHGYIHTITVRDSSAAIQGLVEGRTYYFAVDAFTTSGLKSELSEEAVYTVPPPPSGNYTGLFSQDSGVLPISAGAFSLSVTTRGTYSGKIRTGSGAYSFSGKVDSSYSSTATILRRNAGPLTVHFTLGTSDMSENVFGSVDGGLWTSTLLGNRVAFNSKTHQAPFAGAYTMVVPGVPDNPGQPMGDGYGTVRVGTDGVARFTGVLADKTKISQSAPLSERGYWPVWIPLSSGRGVVAGWLQFVNYLRSGDFNGALTWVKPPDVLSKYYPSGFSLQSQVFGSVYVVPPALLNHILNSNFGTISFSGGNLSSDFANAFVIGSKGTAAGIGGSPMELTFSLSTGRFGGKAVDPANGRAFSFGGVVVQKENAGYGFLAGTNQISHVTVTQ